jgi:hypothetical protein
VGSSSAIWKISLRFFSPPEKPSLTADLEQRRFRLDQLHELHGVELGLAEVLPLRVQRRLEEIGVVHAGNLDRVLKRHEHALAGALVRIQVEEILALVDDGAAGDLVFGMAGQRAGQRALARPVRSHDGVHLAGVHVQVDPFQDRLALDLDLEILDIKHDDSDLSVSLSVLSFQLSAFSVQLSAFSFQLSALRSQVSGLNLIADS